MVMSFMQREVVQFFLHILMWKKSDSLNSALEILGVFMATGMIRNMLQYLIYYFFENII